MPQGAEPPRSAVDSCVVIAAVLSWHEHHEWARQRVEELLVSGRLVLPVHVVFEAYSVMTRMPRPHRLAPADGAALLAGTFEGVAEVAEMPAEEVWPVIRSLPERGVAGGATYDAEILECAVRAGARTLLTLNPRHFERLAVETIELRSPRA